METKKIRLIVGGLGFIALVSLFSLVDYLRNGSASSFFKLDNTTSNLSLALDEDADKDGLSNSDESYWNTDFQNPDTDGDGFLDGEEAAAGTDPTLSGPDDKLFANNLTDTFSDLTLSGLVEGSLKPDSPDFNQSLNLLTFNVVQDGLVSLAPPDKIDLNIVASSKEATVQYAKEVEKKWEMFFMHLGKYLNGVEPKLALIQEEGRESEFNSYFAEQSEEFNRVYDLWVQTPTPQDWESYHSAFAKIIKRFALINTALSQSKEDPIKASLGLGILSTLLEDMTEIVNLYDQRLANENL